MKEQCEQRHRERSLIDGGGGRNKGFLNSMLRILGFIE